MVASKKKLRFVLLSENIKVMFLKILDELIYTKNNPTVSKAFFRSSDTITHFLPEFKSSRNSVTASANADSLSLYLLKQ